MVWPIIALVLLLIIPGATVAFVAGVRSAWALAIGPAVTFSILGVAAWLYGAIDVRYGLGSAALAWGVGMVAALLWRKLVFAPTQPAKGPAGARDVIIHALPAAIGVVVTAVVLATTALTRIAASAQGMESIQQSWDTLWHASVIKSIVENGMASPTRMGEIQNVETHAESFYPAAWHALGGVFAEISGVTVTADMNYLGVILPAILIPLAAATLAWRIADRYSIESSYAAGIAAVVSGTLPVLMPIVIFVGAWPYQVAIALAVIVFSFVTSVPNSPARILIAFLAFLGAAMVHPSAVPTVLFLGGFWWLFHRVWSPVRPGLGPVKARLADVCLILAVLLPALALLIPQWVSGSGQKDDIVEVSAEVDVSRFASWYRAFTMLTRHSEEYRPFWLIILLGCAGIALVTLSPGARRRAWVLPAWLMSAVFVTHAIRHFAGPVGSVLAKYTDLHYSTPHRLVMVSAFVVSATAGVAVARACIWMGSRLKSAAAAATAVAVCAGGLTTYGVVYNSEAAEFAYSSPRQWELIGQADLNAFDWLAKQPEAHAHRTFTSPSQGSGWMYARNGLPVVFPHFDWPIANKYSDTSMLYWHADFLGAGEPWDKKAKNDVDRAAEALDVAFIYASPPDIWKDKPTPRQMGERLPVTPGLAEVYRDREVTIHAVRAVVPEQRIAEMRATSPEPVFIP